MSTLQCANIHFESTQNNRIQYLGSNNFSFVAGGSNTLTINSSSVTVDSSMNLKSSGGGLVSLTPATTGSNFTLTAPARTGNIITSADSGTVTSGMISPGSAGQRLTTNSSGATAWIDGGRTLIQTLTASSGDASIATTNCFSSTYTNYAIEFYNVVPATNGSYGLLRVYSGGAYQAASYIYGVMIPSNYTWSTSATFGLLTWPGGAPHVSSTAVYGGMNGRIIVFNPSNTSYYKEFIGQTGHYYPGNGVDLTASYSFRWQGGAGAITGFQIYFSAGNVTSGTVKIYGWN